MNSNSSESFVLFNQQLASMLGLDLPMPESLRQACREMQDPRMEEVLAAVARDVESGRSYSQALEKHGAGLPDLYSTLVKAGEESGNLAEVLRQAASYHHDMLLLENKLKANLVYPAMLLAGLAGLIVLLGSHVIPNITSIYPGIGGVFTDFTPHGGMSGRALLPWPTRLLAWFGDYHVFTFLLIAASVGAYAGRNGIESWWTENRLRVPLWGDIAASAIIVRVCRTLSVLLKTGASMDSALLLTERTLSDQAAVSALAAARKACGQGRKFGDALASSGFFPASFAWMVSAAEERGTLEECLAEASVYHQHRVDRRSLLLARLIEPVLVLVLGVLVAAVVISFFMPMFSIMNLFGSC